MESGRPAGPSSRARAKRAALARAVLAVALGLWASPAGGTAYGDFRSKVSPASLKPFITDLGGVLGGVAFHSARALGFPGLEAGVAGTFQSRPDRENTILRDAGVGRFGVPMVQVAVGLPRRVDVVLQGSSGQGSRVLGAGLRYGILKRGLLSPLPDLAVSAFADKVNHEHFGAVHYSLNAALSFHLPIVRPYAGAGWDHTTVEVGSAALAEMVGARDSVRATRLTAGLDVFPLPLARFHLAYSMLHGLPALDAGVGIRF